MSSGLSPSSPRVKVVPVPALDDNYMYLLVDIESGEAAAVDPVDATAIIHAASKEEVTLTMILTTHNHFDHAGGNRRLKDRVTTIVAVYGGRGDGAQAVTHEVGDGDVIQLGKGTDIKVLYTPCHTVGHVCYAVDGNVFTGDTMFVAGCGNFNTGSPEQMVDAFDKILSLPDETKVWVGHEYTLNNLRFASFAESSNEKVKEKLQWAEDVRPIHEGGSGTVPSTIADEKATNPFARIDTEGIRAFAGRSSTRAEVMRLVRKGKDDWGRRATGK